MVGSPSGQVFKDRRLAVSLQNKWHSFVAKVEDSEMTQDSLGEVWWAIIIWKLYDLE